VSFDKDTGLMMYNGQPVREIWDDVAGTLITESIGSNGFAGRNIPGAVDLTTIYENDVLIGFHVSTQEEYDKRTEERQAFTSSDNTVNAAEHFEIYKEFGLTYEQATDRLYFNGVLVRYFEDMTPIYVSYSFGVTHFTENGTVDVHAVRDYSELVQNADGSVDPRGKLLELRQYSQEEFDARDIEIFINPSPLTAYSASANVPQSPNDGNVANANSGSPRGSSIVDVFAGVEKFDITFERLTNGTSFNIYYQEQLVRTLIDEAMGTRLSSHESGGNIDIRISRDVNGNITGVEVVEI
jgi:hypothetical protein